MFRNLFRKVLRPLAYEYVRAVSPHPISVPIDPFEVTILEDRAFLDSVQEISPYTLLDTSRLANLWQLCRMTNPAGRIVEVGTYKGGGALHLSNCCPDRKIIICDSFSGFESIDPKLDGNFDKQMFKDSRQEAVESLFRTRQRNYELIAGFFPESCHGKNIGPVSFVHLDVDLYKATIESLYYLHHLMMEKSLIVLDDYLRKTEGVNQAIAEFVAQEREWTCFPLFPGQGLLVHSSWFARNGAS